VASRNVGLEKEISDRTIRVNTTHSALTAGDREIAEKLAKLAGGGLELQAWGVVCWPSCPWLSERLAGSRKIS
jgi:hypothetical protein